MNRLLRAFFVGTLGLALAWSWSIVPVTADTPLFEEAPCKVEVPAELQVRCGYLTVPERRDNPTGKMLRLHVAIIKNTEGIEDAPAVVHLAGGPGGSGTLDLEGWIGFPLLDQYDLITYDQRGTGYAEPSLNCPELEAEETQENLESCRDRLIAEGNDLGAYNSAESAADLNDLRLALGYQSWVLYGVSYGTRLALTAMRDYPEGIESVILDAVYPPNVNSTETENLYGLRAINRMLEGCAQKSACDEAFPDLKANFYTFLEGLNDSPEEIDGVTYDAGVVYDLIFQVMYDTEAIRDLPLALSLAFDGDWELLIELSGGGGAFLRQEPEEIASLDQSEGMQLSVECSEEVAFDSKEKGIENAKTLPDALQEHAITQVESEFSDCETWGVEEAHAVENEAVVSDIPTLILNGMYDPITPPEWGALAAKTLKNSYNFDFPGMGHGAVGAHACPSEIALAFLADPSREPDSGCIALMDLPNFNLE